MVKESEILTQINEVTRLALGQDYFNRIAEIIQNLTGADYTFVSKIDPECANASPIVALQNGKLFKEEKYALLDTPCAQVVNTTKGYFPENVQDLFPKDDHLKEVNAEGYLGVSIPGNGDKNIPFAIITCLYENSPADPEKCIDIIEFIAGILESRIEREYLLVENYELKKSRSKQIKKISASETLLKEIHHRVKNNLQIVASLLNLQKNRTGDPYVQGLIDTSKDRIQSIALVHELLYNSDDFKNVDINLYVDKIITNIINPVDIPGLELNIDVESELVNLDILIPCGLILCEGITNFLKYGVKEEEPSLNISFKGKESARVLCISDNGSGFPQGILNGITDSLGVDLISSLAEQIGGEARLYNDNGAVVEIEYPVN